MLEIGPIANTIKTVQPPPLHAQPATAEEMKPVPQAEIDYAVPPVPVKGGEAGLGEHLDLYDTQASQTPPAAKDAADNSAPSENAAVTEAAAKPESLQSVPDPAAAAEAEKAKEKRKVKLELLGDKTGLPQPSTDPPQPEFPFLTPLGGKALGQAIDARI